MQQNTKIVNPHTEPDTCCVQDDSSTSRLMNGLGLSSTTWPAEQIDCIAAQQKGKRVTASLQQDPKILTPTESLALGCLCAVCRMTRDSSTLTMRNGLGLSVRHLVKQSKHSGLQHSKKARE
jgi:hypothetical protein